MKTAYLVRTYYPQGTLGTLLLNGRVFRTVERPWLDNQDNISCIPEGTYPARPAPSPKRKSTVVWLYNVADRDAIQMHVANFPTDVEGCIGVGSSFLPDELGVADSVRSFNDLLSLIGGEEFRLVITSNNYKSLAIDT